MDVKLSLYVIRCKKTPEEKYPFRYVGTSKDVARRFTEHRGKTDRCADVLRDRQVEELESVTSCEGPEDEDTKVIELMCVYGINSVRGGVFCNKSFTEDQLIDIRRRMTDLMKLKSIQQKIRQHNNLCYTCASPDHFSKDCRSISVRDYHRKHDVHKEDSKKRICSRCDRRGHNKDGCFAMDHTDSTLLECHRCHRSSHTIRNCYAKTYADGGVILECDRRNPRCGALLRNHLCRWERNVLLYISVILLLFLFYRLSAFP